MHAKLTKKLVEGIAPAIQDILVRDTELKGLACKITPKGKRVYLLYYRTLDGRERRPKIGVHGAITCDQARAMAQRWLGEVAAGNDPSEEKQLRRKSATVRDLCQQFIDEHCRRRLKATKLVAVLPTAKDPDAAIFDPYTGQAIVVGSDSGVLTLIDPKAAKVEATIELEPGLEFAAPDGHGRLLVNNSDRNEIDVVDLAARKLVGRYPLAGCQGVTGLAYVEGGRLVSACVNGLAKIVDAASGREIASLAIGKGADAVLYDPGRHLAYVPCGADGTLAVIALSGTDDNSVTGTVKTQIGARTGAVDPVTGAIYLPTAHFDPPVPPATRWMPKPGSFEIVVVGRQ